jgi:hypothetical protein
MKAFTSAPTLGFTNSTGSSPTYKLYFGVPLDDVEGP